MVCCCWPSLVGALNNNCDALGSAEDEGVAHGEDKRLGNKVPPNVDLLLKLVFGVEGGVEDVVTDAKGLKWTLTQVARHDADAWLMVVR